MTDEIKEILDNPKILMLSYGNYISLDDYVKLKDYITNLQEEVNKLTAESTEWESKFYDLQTDLAHEKEKNKIIVKLGDDYKSKNKNAIELCKSLIVFWKKYSPDNNMEIGQFEKVLHTLQGSDKE